MNAEDIASITAMTDEAIALLTKYERLTDRMISADLEIIEEVLLQRQALIDAIEVLRVNTNTIAAVQTPRDQEMLEVLLRGMDASGYRLSDEQALLYRKRQAMVALVRTIEQKDKAVAATVRSYHDRLRDQASNSNMVNDRKIVNYYHSALGVNTKGRNLDSST